MRTKRLALAAVAASAALTAPFAPGAASSSPTARSAAGRTVTLKDIAFKPSRLSVRKGTTVTFRWRDASVVHNVRSRGRSRFKGSPNKSKGTHRVTFRRAGTYRYICTLHTGMDGRISVR